MRLSRSSQNDNLHAMPNTTEHIAVAGENWASIAFKYWQDETLMNELILANSDYADVCIFEGGERLRIPNIEPEVTKAHLAPWRR